MRKFEQLSPREAYAAYIRGSIMVDVRDHAEVDAKVADLKQLIKVPFSELDERLGELPSNRQVVLVSRIGIKSAQAAKILADRGFDQVATMQGGLTAWEAEGLPIR